MDKRQLQHTFHDLFRVHLDGAGYRGEGGLEEVGSVDGMKRMRIDRTRAKYVLQLAKDWIRAHEIGLRFVWVNDDDPSFAFEDHEDWCKEARKGEAALAGHPVEDFHVNNRYRDGVECNHEVEGCLVFGPGDGDPDFKRDDALASMWGIIDADDRYRRSIESELVGEALAEWDKREAEKRSDEAIRTGAKELYAQEGQIKIDDDAEVSPSEGGAYVAAWVFVPDEEG